MRQHEQDAQHHQATRGLHVCPTCAKPFVVPLAVHEMLPDGRFPVVLSCRNCDWHDAGAYAEEDLAALDYALDAITADMEDALQRLTIATELERIDAFAAALDAGGILPEDF